MGALLSLRVVLPSSEMAGVSILSTLQVRSHDLSQIPQKTRGRETVSTKTGQLHLSKNAQAVFALWAPQFAAGDGRRRPLLRRSRCLPRLSRPVANFQTVIAPSNAPHRRSSVDKVPLVPPIQPFGAFFVFCNTALGRTEKVDPYLPKPDLHRLPLFL
jgi:hypothetical protein